MFETIKLEKYEGQNLRKALNDLLIKISSKCCIDQQLMQILSIQLILYNRKDARNNRSRKTGKVTFENN